MQAAQKYANMKAEVDKACTDKFKTCANYGRRHGVYAVLMQKMATESIHKHNKQQSNKKKHIPASKIKLTLNWFPLTQKCCLLSGCDCPGHSINRSSPQKCFWHNLARNIIHDASLLKYIKDNIIKEDIYGRENQALDNNNNKYHGNG